MSSMKRIVIFFFFDPDGIVDRYAEYFLADLARNAERVVVVCNGKLTDAGRALFLRHTEEIIVRPNEGLDVWAYKTGLEHITWAGLDAYDELVLCNFTSFGPLYPFAEMFSAMEKREDLDFWGITKFNYVPYDPMGTIEYNCIPEHLQSNFIAVRKKLFRSPGYQSFWNDMPPIRSYNESIGRYEAVFTKKFADMGYRWDTYVPMDDLKDVATQPLMMCSYELVAHRRCPIVKRRMFFQSYFDILAETDGSNCRKTLDCIREHCDYDTGMIWENLLRTCDMADIKRNLNLNYILPSNFSAGPSKSRIALIFHLHFADQIGYCLRFIANLPENTDLYIATTSQEIKAELEKAFRDRVGGRAEIHVVPNRGRDIGSLLVEFRSIVPDYDYICYAHDKKAGQVKPQAIGLSFRDKCFENTLGSRRYVENIIRLFDENPYLGMVMPPYPDHGAFFFILHNAWGMNYGKTRKLAEKMKLRRLPDQNKEPIAPLGSFFWIRTAACRTLLSLPWKYEDFPEEPLPGDGTLLHALERLRPYTVQHDGYYCAWVMSDDYARVELTNLHFMLREICCALNMDTANFQSYIFAIWNRLGSLRIFSRDWFNAKAQKWLPASMLPPLKRIYQKVRKLFTR